MTEKTDDTWNRLYELVLEGYIIVEKFVLTPDGYAPVWFVHPPEASQFVQACLSLTVDFRKKDYELPEPNTPRTWEEARMVGHFGRPVPRFPRSLFGPSSDTRQGRDLSDTAEGQADPAVPQTSSDSGEDTDH